MSRSSTYTFTAADFGFSDPNDSPANSFGRLLITSVPASGTLKNGATTLNAGDFVTIADINANQLTFTPAGSNTSFTFQVEDTGSTANTGVILDQSANTISFTVNEPPTADNVGPFVAGEDATAPLRIAITLSGNDADLGDVVESFKIETASANGQLFDVATGGSALAAGAIIPATGSGPWTAVLYFQPNADFNGATSFTYSSFDGVQNGLAATASINVSAVADIAADTATTNEDTAVNVLVLANDTFEGTERSPVSRARHPARSP